MLSIFADSFLTATGSKKWDSPDHWRQQRHTITPAEARLRDQRQMRKWLRDTGIM